MPIACVCWFATTLLAQSSIAAPHVAAVARSSAAQSKGSLEVDLKEDGYTISLKLAKISFDTTGAANGIIASVSVVSPPDVSLAISVASPKIVKGVVKTKDAGLWRLKRTGKAAPTLSVPKDSLSRIEAMLKDARAAAAAHREALEADKDWQALPNPNTAEALLDFLDKHPAGSRAAQATALLKTMLVLHVSPTDPIDDQDKALSLLASAGSAFEGYRFALAQQPVDIKSLSLAIPPIVDTLTGFIDIDGRRAVGPPRLTSDQKVALGNEGYDELKKNLRTHVFLDDSAPYKLVILIHDGGGVTADGHRLWGMVQIYSLILDVASKTIVWAHSGTWGLVDRDPVPTGGYAGTIVSKQLIGSDSAQP